MWDFVRFAGLVFLIIWLAAYAFADKVIHEPYPWPNAEYPSREKPMRREFTEPLEFGEKYPKETPKDIKDYDYGKSKVKKKKTTKAKPKVKIKQKIMPVPEVKPEIAEPLKPIEPVLPTIREEGSSISEPPETPLRGKPETVVVATERTTDKRTWLGLIILAALGIFFWRKR